MCQLDLLIRGSVGFVIKFISVPQDNSHRRRIVIHNLCVATSVIIQVNNSKLLNTLLSN